MPVETPSSGPKATSDDALSRYAFGAAFVSSAGGLISIALSHFCLGLALLLLLLSKTRLRLPPVVWPLGGFLAWTVVAALAAGDPAGALPQLKKFFVFAMLPVVFSLFPLLDQAHRLLQAWFTCALAAAGWSIVQFWEKLSAARAAGQDFLSSYAPDRIAGFFSHWMTFSETILIVSVTLASYLLFSASGRRRGKVVWFAAGFVLGMALVLSFTRGVWLAGLLAVIYLVWNWKKRFLLLIPVALAIAVVAAPDAARRRLESMIDPEANPARVIMWRTGWRMIQAHPWVGVGPMQVGPRFREFLPPDVTDLPDAYYGHLHNMFVHYAAERGLPAAAMLLWLLGKILWDHGRALRKLRPGYGDRRFLLHAGIASTIAVLIIGMFDIALGDSEVLALYLALVALGYRAAEAQTAGSSKVSPV